MPLLRLAAWFLWMTPFVAARSSSRFAACRLARAAALSPAAIASLTFLTAVLTPLRTDLFAVAALAFVSTRFFWLLMFANLRSFLPGVCEWCPSAQWAADEPSDGS